MLDNGADNPYKTLGWHLKFAREQLKESLAEVSGAVEIEADALDKIEQGENCPSEDILLLLITHLGLEDAEANSLWHLAGFSDQLNDTSNGQIAVNMPNDLRIIYTDMLHVMVNDYGIVMNFMQGAGLGNQPLAVSRVGMSKKQARRIIDILQKSLDNPQVKAKPRFLPTPKKHKDATDIN